jgi:hypothetical protein
MGIPTIRVALERITNRHHPSHPNWQLVPNSLRSDTNESVHPRFVVAQVSSLAKKTSG